MMSARSRAFTLTELLVVIGIVALLAAIAFPVMGGIRKRAQTTTCLSNTKQYALAMQAYTQDYDGNYPLTTTAIFTNGTSHEANTLSWRELLYPYMKIKDLSCPARDIPFGMPISSSTTGYALNSDLNHDEVVGENKTRSVGKNEASVLLQSRIVAVFDCVVPYTAMNNTDSGEKEIEHGGRRVIPGAIRHNGGGNYAFADGHAKWFHPDAFTRKCSNTHNKPCFTP